MTASKLPSAPSPAGETASEATWIPGSFLPVDADAVQCGECLDVIAQYGTAWLNKYGMAHHYCGGEINKWQPHFPARPSTPEAEDVIELGFCADYPDVPHRKVICSDPGTWKPMPADLAEAMRNKAERLRVFQTSRGEFEAECRRRGLEPLPFAQWLVLHYHAAQRPAAPIAQAAVELIQEVENLRIAIREADKRSDYGWDAANRKAGECRKAEAEAHYYKQLIEETIQRAEFAESAIKQVYDVVDDAPVNIAWGHCRDLLSNLRHKLLLAQSIWKTVAKPSAGGGWIAVETAAKIVCQMCRDGAPLERTKGGIFHNPPMPVVRGSWPYRCHAEAIRLAASGQEGDQHEQ